MEKINALAADIGGSYIRMSRVDDCGALHGPVLRRSTPVDDLEQFIQTLSDLVAELRQDAGNGSRLAIATAGLLNPATGVMRAANIPCLNNIAPAAALSEKLGCQVVLVNDADAFALAEATRGAGVGHVTVLGAVIGTGIGGGLVIDGRAVRGSGGVAGEWGHGPIASHHPHVLNRPLKRMQCGCGQHGCADTFGGARGIERLHKLLGHPHQTTAQIVTGWKGRAAAASQTIDVWAEMLSEPLSLALNVTGASIVPVGGGLSSEPALVAKLDQAVRARILNETDQALLVPSLLGADAGLIGAALLARQISEGRP
ncbi:MAG: ROK family protein [Rhodobacteraceae bacterium]|nr:ROK family protein [Paracoccaceae bacterium]